LHRGFNGPGHVPFVRPREETPDWVELVAAIPKDQIDTLVRKKLADLELYNTQIEGTQKRYDAVFDGENEEPGASHEENAKTLGIDKINHGVV